MLRLLRIVLVVAAVPLVASLALAGCEDDTTDTSGPADLAVSVPSTDMATHD